MKIKVYDDKYHKEKDGLIFDEDFIIQALDALLIEKNKAFDMVKNITSYTEESFGIPQVKELINLFHGDK